LIKEQPDSLFQGLNITTGLTIMIKKGIKSFRDYRKSMVHRRDAAEALFQISDLPPYKLHHELPIEEESQLDYNDTYTYDNQYLGLDDDDT